MDRSRAYAGHPAHHAFHFAPPRLVGRCEPRASILLAVRALARAPWLNCGSASRKLGLLICLFVGAFGAPNRAHADYALGPGDKLQISAYGISDLSRQVVVSADGAIDLPLIGTLHVAGMSAAQLKEKVRATFVAKGLLSQPDIIVEITEYRPFFISGDVSRPGAYPFRPGLTVRQAVAVSGGFDALRYHSATNPFLDSADLRDRQEQSAVDLFRESVRLARYQAQLKGADDFVVNSKDKPPVDPTVAKAILDSERQLLKQDVNSDKNQRSSDQRAIDLARAQAQALQIELQSEARASQQQTGEVARMQGLYQRGIAPVVRLSEEQRAGSAAESRALTTQAALSTAQRSLEELVRKAQQNEEARTRDTLAHVQDSEVNLAKIKSDIEANNAKFEVLGSARATFGASPEARSTVRIYRKDSDGAHTLLGRVRRCGRTRRSRGNRTQSLWPLAPTDDPLGS